MSDIKLRERFPSVYSGFKEIDRLSESEQSLFDSLNFEVKQLSNNQFVLTASEKGLSEYEEILKIQRYQTESIESRRLRIINRLSDAPPYSYIRLIMKLNSLLGKGTYEVDLIPEKYQIVISIHVAEPEIIAEIQKMFTEMLPANIKWVVQNDIICYNIIEEYFGQALSFGMNYILS